MSEPDIVLTLREWRQQHCERFGVWPAMWVLSGAEMTAMKRTDDYLNATRYGSSSEPMTWSGLAFYTVHDGPGARAALLTGLMPLCNRQNLHEWMSLPCNEELLHGPRQLRNRWYGRGIVGTHIVSREVIERCARELHEIGCNPARPTATEIPALVDEIPGPMERLEARRRRFANCPLCKGTGRQMDERVSGLQVIGLQVIVLCDCPLGEMSTTVAQIVNPRVRSGINDFASHARRAHCGRASAPIRWQDPEAIERALSKC